MKKEIKMIERYTYKVHPDADYQSVKVYRKLNGIADLCKLLIDWEQDENLHEMRGNLFVCRVRDGKNGSEEKNYSIDIEVEKDGVYS